MEENSRGTSRKFKQYLLIVPQSSGSEVITVDEINTYTLINANHLVMVDGVQTFWLKDANNNITMEILIKPIVTEKMTVQGDKLNRYGSR